MLGAMTVFFFKKKEFRDFKNIERNVQYYAEEGIKTVDSASGLLQGDISLFSGQELSIKSPGASLMGFAQIINMAELCIFEWANKNPKEIMKELLRKKMVEQDKNKGIRHAAYESLSGAIKEEIDSVLKNLEKTGVYSEQ
jgi:hypothetical protein